MIDNKNNVPISLEEAKQLVSYIESDDAESANALLEAVSMKASAELFAEVGKLTRQLHDSLHNVQLDERIADLASEDIPDAQTRLLYVIDETEKAANTTMDAVDASMPIVESLSGKLEAIIPEWQKLMTRSISSGEFKPLCHNVDAFLKDTSEGTDKLTSLLTEVLMAQGYQDLTGQVIRRVIELVNEVQDSLVNMLTMFGEPGSSTTPPKAEDAIDGITAEGPIMDAAERDDVVSGQDDVDDLLSSLGF